MTAGAVGSASYLYGIKPGTGAINSESLITNGGIIFTGATTGLAYGNGDLFLAAGAVGSAYYLYGIDPSTGASNSESLIIDNGTPFIGAITGLAYVSAVPLPSSLALFGLGLMIVAVVRKTRLTLMISHREEGTSLPC